MMRHLSLSILILPLCLCAAGLNLGNLEKINLKGFQTNGITAVQQNGKEDTFSWTINGDNAKIQKPNYDLEGFRMTIHDSEVQTGQEGEYHLESPSCLYNQDKRTVSSESVIHLDGADGIDISGIGYDIYLQDEKNGLRIVIRDAVRIEFQLGSFQKWHQKDK